MFILILNANINDGEHEKTNYTSKTQVFISDLSRLNIDKHCLSLQCAQNDPKFLPISCEERLNPICRNQMNLVQGKFKLNVF